MSIQGILGIMQSVEAVIRNPKLNGQIVAVSGTIYLGPPFRDNDFVLLQKAGGLNGIGLEAARPSTADRAILLNEDLLGSKFLGNVSRACGGFAYKYDSVVVGTVHFDASSGFGALIDDILIIVFQDWQEISSKREIAFMFFDREKKISAPYAGMKDNHGVPILKIF